MNRVDTSIDETLQQMLAGREINRENLQMLILQIDEEITRLYLERQKLNEQYNEVSKAKLDLRTKQEALKARIMHLSRVQKMCKNLLAFTPR